jgi:hypothetical protein
MKPNASPKSGGAASSGSVNLRSILVTLAVGFLVALGYLRIKGEEMRLSYEISFYKRTEETLTRDNRILSATYMTLKRPSRIGELAEKMGFKFPTQEDVIFIDETTLVGERNEK